MFMFLRFYVRKIYVRKIYVRKFYVRKILCPQKRYVRKNVMSGTLFHTPFLFSRNKRTISMHVNACSHLRL
jgi:hypothetical protein